MDWEPTDRERIDAALICATEIGMSPAMTLSNVMAALGYDFGEPDQIEHQVMQFYADTDNNPFVQAQLEARILLDAGHLEALSQGVKKHTHDWHDRNRLSDALAYVQGGIEDDDVSAKDIARLIVTALGFAIPRFGVNVFNDALGEVTKEYLSEIEPK